VTMRPGPEGERVWFALSPFSWQLWLVILGTVLSMAVLFMIIDKLSPYGKRPETEPNWIYHVSTQRTRRLHTRAPNHPGYPHA
jgi:hypothetical protein